MQFGLDYVSGPSIADLKAAGVTFVCRYLSYVNDLTRVKILTASEAETLLKADIAIVSNYEWYAQRATEGYASGQQDAQIAVNQHHACGGPPDSPIYFSVDVDVAGESVVSYFNGIHSVLPLSRIGAYGSYRVIKYLLDNHLISWAWQTYAWSGGQWEPRRNIEQYENGMTIGGASVDYNHALTSNFGQWRMTTMIDLSNAEVANFFEENGNVWKCKSNSKVIGGAILTFYTKFGNEALCGLTFLGLPVSNEIALAGSKHGAVKQHYENGVVFYDPAHEFDSRPGDNASCYLAHLYQGQGQDPRIAELSATIASLQTQINNAPTNVALQQELDAANAKIAQIKTLVG